MPIRVKCEKCKKTLSVKDHLAGKKIKCPLCQGVVAVPLASPTKEPPAAAKSGGAPAPKPAPKAGAPPPGAAKKSTAANPVLKSKPAPGKPETNGAAPPANGEKTNGHVPSEPPPENLDEEALAALADEPPPPEETQTPATIDFKCQWCDEEVKLPFELAGKQAQCPNPECRRLVKVPLPKVAEKKDWRKMDRQGPAAARINQPEALENAWGTEEASKARADSLAQAGIGVPQKPPRGVLGWMKIGGYVLLAIGGVAALAVGGKSLLAERSEVLTITQIKLLTESTPHNTPKITDPLLVSEAHRTIAMYHLHGREPKLNDAIRDFNSAFSTIKIGDVSNIDTPYLNEQFFLMDLALSRIDLSTEASDPVTLDRVTKQWDKALENCKSALREIKSPEMQVIALREIATRLKQKDKKEMAIALAGGLSGDAAQKKRPLAFRQQIALVIQADKLDQLPGVTEPKLGENDELGLAMGPLRVGFAEGYARKDSYDQAFKIANAKGSEIDRLDANIGIASVALLDKKKDKAAEAFKTALDVAKNPNTLPRPTAWHLLELTRIGARLEDPAVADIVKELPLSFKARAQLEIVLAKCDKATTPLDAATLNDLDAAAEKDRVTVALGWSVLARQNARTGGSRKQLEKAMKAEDASLARPMLDVGWFQGLVK
jgi:hypothetical protein